MDRITTHWDSATRCGPNRIKLLSDNSTMAADRVVAADLVGCSGDGTEQRSLAGAKRTGEDSGRATCWTKRFS